MSKQKLDVTAYLNAIEDCGCYINITCHKGQPVGIEEGVVCEDGKRRKYRKAKKEYHAAIVADGRDAVDRKIAAECIRRGSWYEWPYDSEWPFVPRRKEAEF